MLRHSLQMATETVAKRLKATTPLIGTHNGHFHADEALAVYLLRLLPSYSSSTLLRTRDPTRLAECDIVVDVGGEYNPEKHRYDHHQRNFTATFPNHTTKLSSAGLIYLHFGRTIISQYTSLPYDHPDVDRLFEKIYTDFIEALDANDNGISVYDPEAVAAAGLQKRFKDNAVTLGSLIGDLNYSDASGGLQGEDSLFLRASTFIGEIFLRKLRSASQSWLPALAIVGSAYTSRRETAHPSGRIIILSTSDTPWKEHLHNLEREVSGVGSKSSSYPDDQVYYVLYPDSAAANPKWRIQCVAVAEGSFESRKPLPEAWRGLRDEELDTLLAAESDKAGQERIPAGAVFVHATGFIGGHKTKEGALAMAVLSLENL